MKLRTKLFILVGLVFAQITVDIMVAQMMSAINIAILALLLNLIITTRKANI